MWNAYTDPIPSEAAQELPSKLLDILIDLILNSDDDDSEDLAVWAMEAIASAVGLSVQVGDHDPVKRYKQFEEAALGTLVISGEQHREYREPLLQVAAQHCREISKIGHDWAAERDGNQRVAYLDGTPWPLINMPSS